MPTILTIDTSSDHCAAALFSNGKTFTVFSTEAKSHAKSLLGLVDSLLLQADIKMDAFDAIAVVAGPGSFTGLRIGIGVVQGLAFALNKPVILLSSLELLAFSSRSASPHEGVMVALKSKADEVYFGCYEFVADSAVQALGQETVGEPRSLKLPASALKIQSWLGVGTGWEYLEEIKRALKVDPDEICVDFEVIGENLSSLALEKFEQGKLVSPDQALPNYVKERMSYVKGK